MSGGEVRVRVLVVEDEPLIGMDIEYAVEGLGHDVVGPVAELGGALDLAADETLGCAILDVNIRGGNSYPVADMLIKRGVPVLILSGYGMQTLPERLRDEARLCKPFTTEQLDQAICSLCARTLNSRRSECADGFNKAGRTSSAWVSAPH